MNEIMTAQEIQSAVGRNAVQIGALAESIGVISDTIKRHEISIRQHDEKFAQVDSFIAEQKDKEIIDAYEVANLSRCIKNRCIDILGEHDRLDLLGKFMQKCRIDLKDNTHYVGKAGVYTRKLYYRQLLDYIGNWTPEAWGTTGYIVHLDLLRKQRA